MKTKLFLLLVILAGIRASAQTTAFTFQGQLDDNGGPANGLFDFQFTLLDAGTNGNILGETTNAAVTVTNGIFTTGIDFGASVFTGAPRWLLLGVRTNGSLGPFTNLPPADLITAVPYAINAYSASNLLGTLSVTNLTGNLSVNQLPPGVVTDGQSGVSLAGSFSGNGDGLTTLNAASLSGSVPPGTLTSVPAASLTGTVPLTQLPGVLVTNTETNVTLSGIFSGDGSGLTNLNATNITGAIPSAQLPPFLVTNGETGVALSGGIFSGTFVGDGSGLTILSASSLTGSVPPGALTSVPAASLTGTVPLTQLPDVLVTNTETNVTLSGIFSGDGSGLTNLNATNLTGAIPSAQLPPFIVTNGETGVALSGGAFSGTFTGNGSGLTGLSASQLGGALSVSQLPSSVITQGEDFVQLNGTFNGTFTGNGSGLNSINAGALAGTLPPGLLGSIPAASLTGTVPSSALSGTYGNALSLSNPGNVIAGTILNAFSSSLADVIGDLTVTNSAVFTNAEVLITNNAGQGIVESPGGITNTGNLRLGGWLVGPTTNAGGFWITNGALFVTNVGLSSGVILGGNTGNIAFSGTIKGNGSGLTDAGGSPIGTSVSNLALTIGSNDTNFTLAASNSVMLGASNSVFVASNAVLGLADAFTLGASNALLGSSEAFTLLASNTLETALLSTGTAISNGATLTTTLLAGPTTNIGKLLVTNGTLVVSNSTGSVTVNNGNIAFSGTLTGDGSQLTGISAGGGGATAAGFNFGYDTTASQTGGASFRNITLNTPQSSSSGWSYAAGTFTVTAGGLYYITYTAEIETPTGTASTGTFQVLHNASAIPGAGVALNFAFEGVMAVSQSFMVSLNPADTLQFQFKADVADVQLTSLSGTPDFTVNIVKLQ